MNIQAILEDWKAGLTHGEIRVKHNLLGFEEFAIIDCSKGLTIKEIRDRLSLLSADMTGKQIKTIMQRGATEWKLNYS